MVDARRKGAAGEREFCNLLQEQLGVEVVRNLEQTRSGGHDLVVLEDQGNEASAELDRYAIEIKRHEKVTPSLLSSWWDQTLLQAERASRVPCLAYRQNRTPWRVMVPIFAVNPGMTQCQAIQWTVTMSIDAFCCVIREQLQ